MTNLLVLTCARSQAENPWRYIEELLPRIDRELEPRRPSPATWPDHKGIVCDGPYGGPRPPGWEIFEYERPPDTLRTKNKLPYWHLLKVGLDLGGELLALEDDVVFCKNALRRMLTFPVPSDLGWVQFFSPSILRAWDTFPGLWRPPLSSSIFLQAAKYPERTLTQLDAWSRDPRYSMFGESDVALAMAAAALEISYGVHSPDLVQHVGEISEASPTLALNDWRTSVCWPGEKFDALSLYQRDELYR